MEDESLINLQLKNLYNDLYIDGYHSKFHTHSKVFYPNINNLVPKKSCILDVGCSLGNAMIDLNNHGYIMYGIDISDIAINKCIEKKLNAKFGYSHDIPYEDKMFDAIVCTEVLEHVHENDLDKTFDEFNRVLKVGGLCFLQLSKVLEKAKVSSKILSKHKISNLHISVFDTNYWQSLINRKNFQTIHTITNSHSTLRLILKKENN